MIKVCGIKGKKFNSLFDLSKHQPKPNSTSKVIALFDIKETNHGLEKRIKHGIVKQAFQIIDFEVLPMANKKKYPRNFKTGNLHKQTKIVTMEIKSVI